MSLRKVANVVGLLQVFLSLSMFATAIVAGWYAEGDAGGFVASGAITLVVGWAVWISTRFEGDITGREGFAIVTMAWTATALFGSLPYLITGVLESPIAALFEAMSGFTTTGATVFADVEALPHGVLFWRSLTHWLGGMGIIVLVIAVLPFLGVGGMQLFRAEVPGPVADKVRPRVAETARRLWLIYVGITVLTRMLIGDVQAHHHEPGLGIIYITASILLLAIANLIVRYGSHRYPSSIPGIEGRSDE